MPVDTYSGVDDIKKLKFSRTPLSKQNKEMTREQEKNSTSNEIKKLQCDLCKLSYPSEKELTEHLVSLMHHNKLGDEKNVPHCCTLCGYTCFAMTEYRAHITSAKHQNKLSILRGENVKESTFRGNKRFTKSYRGHTPVYHRKDSGSRFSLNHSSSSAESFHDTFSNSHEKQYYNRRRDEENMNARSGRWGYNSNRSRNKYRVSHPDEETYEPWGSGVYGNYRINGSNSHHQPSTFYFCGNNNGRIVSKDPFNSNVPFENNYIDFTSDEWDEQSLIRQEQYLNSMSDEPYSSKLNVSHFSEYPKDKLENERRQSLVSEMNGRDRKRPRSDYDVEELLPKSSKAVSSNSSSDPVQNLRSERTDHQSPMISTKRSVPPDRATINETSNSLLKKAELLCKELREKRSEDALLKTKISDMILIENNSENDIQNNPSNSGRNASNSLEKNSKAFTNNGDLAKRTLSKLDTFSEDSRNVKMLHKVSTLSSYDDKNSNFADTRESLSGKHSASFSKSKFSTKNSSNSSDSKDKSILSNIQASSSSPTSTQDQSKLVSNEIVANSYSSFNKKDKQKSSNSSSKSPKFTSSDQDRQLCNKKAETNIQPETLNCDTPIGQERKSRHRTFSAEFSSEKSTDLVSKASQKLTVKSVSKDHLQKLVNAPRSRDERLKLAKLLHSREEHKALPSSSARSNLQLEGLYDSEQDFFNMNMDMDLCNISNDLTIKIEDLTDGVRQQIIALMRDDSANLNPSLTGRDAVSADVIVLSDNETEMPKGNNYRQSDNTCSDAIDDVPLSKKKKKTTKQLIKSESFHSAKVKRRAQSDHTDYDNQELSYARCKADNKDTSLSEDPSSYYEGPVMVAANKNVNTKLKPGSVDTVKTKTSSAALSNSPLSRLGQSNSVSVSKNVTSSPGHADLNRDNVSLRYPLIMDAVRTSDRASVSLQGSPSSPLSAKVTMSTTELTSSLPASTTSSSMQPHSSQPLPPSRNLTLPPSTWLVERESPTVMPADGNNLHNVSVASNCAMENISDRHGAIGKMVFKTDAQVIEISDEIEYERGTAQSADIFPEELLTLSEREEEIKQEMVSLDLRLSRLHRLLEQAVSQINKCTERRSQLLEETQVMSNKRITLLRETAAAHLRGKTKDTGLNVASPVASAPPAISRSNSNTNSSPSVVTASLNAQSAGTSLSKEDWLAKFSSFLPPESVFQNKSSTAQSSSLPNNSSDTLTQQIDHPTSLSHSTSRQRMESDTEPTNDDVNNHQVMDTVTRKNAEMKLSNTNPKRLESGDNLTGNIDKTVPSSEKFLALRHQNEVPSKQRTISTLSSMSTISEIFSRPLVYLGSFKSAETLPLRAPVIMLNDSSNVTENNLEDSVADGHQVTSQDSDIGSSTSRSSLGEKISRYCKNTPNASLESTGNTATYVKSHKKSKDVVKPCFVSLKRLDDVHKKGSHHTLDKKSAEALHLLERNNESVASRKIPSPKSGNVKKKKMRTKHQRDISDIKRQLRQRILSTSSSSSSSSSASEAEGNEQELSQRTGTSSKESKKMATDSLKNRLKSEISPSKTTDIIIAECDSSTSLGVVDPQSITRRMNNIKELQEKFDKVFGHATSSTKDPELIHVNDSSEEEKSHLKSNTEIVSAHSDEETFLRSKSTYKKSSDTSKLNLDSAENMRNVKNNHSEYNSFDLEALQVSSKEKKSRFPSKHGPVLELCVLHSDLYVAYCNYGVSIYDLYEFSKKPRKKMKSPGLQCMAVTELVQGRGTVITGCGWRLALCHPEKHNDLQHFSIDVGTTVKCLLVIGSLVYSGLETGEICVFNIVKQKMEVKDRFICSDHPLHCLASAQEGSSRLICASSQDGTILVINSFTGLPLRILTGHSKTSFSLTVHGQSVFSGSGDSTVIAHNIHTGAISHIIKDNKGLVKTVFYHEGFLFTGGMDRLVRCYDIQNFKLTQVYYGAERTVICKIYVVNNMLITGNTSGAVDCVHLDLKAENWCRKSGCRLNFGNKTHLFWHIMEDHSITDLNKEPGL